jgi:hypothetical protein
MKIPMRSSPNDSTYFQTRARQEKPWQSAMRAAELDAHEEPARRTDDVGRAREFFLDQAIDLLTQRRLLRLGCQGNRNNERNNSGQERAERIHDAIPRKEETAGLYLLAYVYFGRTPAAPAI